MLRIYQSGEVPSYVPTVDNPNIVCVAIGNRPLEVEWFAKHFNYDFRYEIETHSIDNYETVKIFKWK